jgi:hypothetical protein
MSEQTTYDQGRGVSGRVALLLAGAAMALGGGLAWGSGGALAAWGTWIMLALIYEHLRQA